MSLTHSDRVRTAVDWMGRGVEASEIGVFDDHDGGTFLGFADPDGGMKQLRIRGETPLIPHEARGRSVRRFRGAKRGLGERPRATRSLSQRRKLGNSLSVCDEAGR